MPRASVIIPTKGRPLAVADAVASLFAGSEQDFELIIVDQTPDESTRQALAPYLADPRVHYRTNRRPGYGAASSRNIGIALSSAEIVAIIDDDVVVQPDWLARILAEFAADPELMFIPGRLTAPPYDPATGYIPASCPFPGIPRWRLPHEVAGANFSMRRALFDRIGGYDEFCGPGSRIGAADDADLTLRAMLAGLKIKPCPDIEVIHRHGFRPRVDGDALVRRYHRGNGGVFGRSARRGALEPTAWFLLREAKYAAEALLNLARGRGTSGFGDAGQRLAGFWKGFTLSPRAGYVSGADLARLRRTLAAEAAPLPSGASPDSLASAEGQRRAADTVTMPNEGRGR